MSTTCKTCKGTGYMTINVTTDYDSGAGHKEIVSCDECELGRENFERDGL